VVEPLTVAQVTPYAWEDAHEVNLVVRGLSGELARRGHRVLVLAPTRSPQHARDGRGTVRAAAGDTDRLLDGESLRVLPIGELLEVPGRRGGARNHQHKHWRNAGWRDLPERRLRGAGPHQPPATDSEHESYYRQKGYAR